MSNKSNPRVWAPILFIVGILALSRILSFMGLDPWTERVIIGLFIVVMGTLLYFFVYKDTKPSSKE